MLKLVLLGMFFFSLTSTVLADDRYDSNKKGVAAVHSQLYRMNCAECHFAYQPGFLPRRSWQALMEISALQDHFGDNAELDASDSRSVLAYLVENAADDADYKRSKKMMRSIRVDETPLRITEVAYFKRKHDDISLRWVTGNSKVKSWSNCLACHSTAETGSFEEDDVLIPGYGRWED